MQQPKASNVFLVVSFVWEMVDGTQIKVCKTLFKGWTLNMCSSCLNVADHRFKETEKTRSTSSLYYLVTSFSEVAD